MPAMSPTMTEGNIASWKVKEGDSFSTGDVLLEIETDKAQMDVEAQDDGILAKITQGDGTKAVKVGTRIAVLAEPGDDLSSLEIPPESEAKPQDGQPRRQDRPSPQEETSGGIDRTEGSESAAEGPPSSKPNADAAAGGAANTAKGPASPTGAKPQKQTYPLYPSVQHLLHERGLSSEDANKIPASGPNGRLLKGDVLAYLGQIDKSYSAAQSQRIDKLGHLDLSNIQLAPKKAPESAKKAAAEQLPKATPELPIEVTLPVDLAAALACQKRLEDTLNIHLPLSTLIARASDVANDELPRKKTPPSADELFYSVLGSGSTRTPKVSRGHYVPRLSSFGPSMPVNKSTTKRQSDIYNLLTGKNTSVARRSSSLPAAAIATPPLNIFTLSVPKAEKDRAQVFLQRMKLVLEQEPGRLVI
ncbi:MAG: pyridoxine biosynthesis protein [Bathelium mastoideum]|nr:MAG: pyridoxine biosynthesis protein [Bathelium mastoideum]